ncbi:MAG: hypothetical protein Q7T26_04400 [Dehalococcoidia bacterium]|nr:hypothetical protein [Dehalococcoidia bacterium]
MRVQPIVGRPGKRPASLRRDVAAGKLREVFRRLRGAYGPQRWWPAETPFEVIVGAILTQAAAWTNVERAIKRLKEEGMLSPRAIREAPRDRLAVIIRSAGYFNAKAAKLQAVCLHLGERYGDSLDRLFDQDVAALRAELLGLYGVGEETADSIILYAAGKPSFVIDAYTRRILARLGVRPREDSYAAHQALFMERLPPSAPLFNEYHALLVRHGKESCVKSMPRCAGCCLADICRHARRSGDCALRGSRRE